MTFVYPDFQTLTQNEFEGADWFVENVRRNTVLIIAPHGGRIEPHTSEIARAIADGDSSIFTFNGMKKSDNRTMHVSSNNYHQPRLDALLKDAETVVSIHGCVSETQVTEIGGLDTELGVRISGALTEAGFSVAEPAPTRAGKKQTNVCNGGITGKGAQLEISRSLRNALAIDEELLAYYARAIRSAL